MPAGLRRGASKSRECRETPSETSAAGGPRRAACRARSREVNANLDAHVAKTHRPNGRAERGKPSPIATVSRSLRRPLREGRRLVELGKSARRNPCQGDLGRASATCERPSRSGSDCLESRRATVAASRTWTGAIRVDGDPPAAPLPRRRRASFWEPHGRYERTTRSLIALPLEPTASYDANFALAAARAFCV